MRHLNACPAIYLQAQYVYTRDQKRSFYCYNFGIFRIFFFIFYYFSVRFVFKDCATIRSRYCMRIVQIEQKRRPRKRATRYFSFIVHVDYLVCFFLSVRTYPYSFHLKTVTNILGLRHQGKVPSSNATNRWKK